MIPWHSAQFDQHEQVCGFVDPRHGLRAIVAIHSTALGPAVGGTRFWPYPEESLALEDVLRLSRAMSYKCALAGVPFGGGKAVIIGDPRRLKTRELLHSYGRYLNRIGNTFCTGEDVGMSVADCETIREVSPYVAGTNSAGAGDPSAHTAKGVFNGMRAVIEVRLDRSDFTDVHVAVQGLGNVGWRLCELLHAAGARLSVADIRPEHTARAQRTFSAQVVSPNAIHAAAADIFAPCALGGVINRHTLDGLRVKAIAGAANNQLEADEIGVALQQLGILFAPDYVINAGGVLGGVEELARVPGRTLPPVEPLEARLHGIYERLQSIFERAGSEGRTPEDTANRMAQEMIGRPAL